MISRRTLFTGVAVAPFAAVVGGGERTSDAAVSAKRSFPQGQDERCCASVIFRTLC